MCDVALSGGEPSFHVGNLDVDLERRHRGAAVDLDHHLFRINRYMSAHDGQDLLAQDQHQVPLTRGRAFIFEQDAKPLASDRRGTAPPCETEDAHAALRRNNFSSNPFFSAGMLISTSSPLSRRAASA